MTPPTTPKLETMKRRWVGGGGSWTLKCLSDVPVIERPNHFEALDKNKTNKALNLKNYAKTNFILILFDILFTNKLWHAYLTREENTINKSIF